MADMYRIGPAARRLAGAVLTAVLLAIGSASEAQEVTTPDSFAPGRVVSVNEAGDLKLEDGRLVRIAGLDVPLPLGERAALLSDALVGWTVSIAPVGRDLDRRGRIWATVVRGDGADMGAFLLESGVARLHPRPDLSLPQVYFAVEAAARAAGRGLWGNDATRVRNADDASALLGRYGVVEGTVLDAALVRGRIFLNFGHDRTKDFTVTVAPEEADRFEAAGLAPATLLGRRIRVRGYVEAVRGPSITADDPRQIEVLGP